MPSQTERQSEVTNGESHRARALRIASDQQVTSAGDFAIVHALLAIEEAIRNVAHNINNCPPRNDADDQRFYAGERYQ